MVRQATFDLDDLDGTPDPPHAPAWRWWDPWPEGLSHRQCLILQIARDKRALAEETDEEWWRAFYAERIASYRAAIAALENGE